MLIKVTPREKVSTLLRSTVLRSDDSELDSLTISGARYCVVPDMKFANGSYLISGFKGVERPKSMSLRVQRSSWKMMFHGFKSL